jgi:O-antigen/teichoic acid export membrane protein
VPAENLAPHGLGATQAPGGPDPDADPVVEANAMLGGGGRGLWYALHPSAWRSVLASSRYRREALTSSAMSIAAFSIGLVTGPVLARTLGPQGRGEIAAVVQPAWLLGWLLCFGLPLAAAYWLDDVPEGDLLATTASFGLAVGGVICLALWFVAPVYLAGHSAATLLWARLFLVILPLSAGVNTALEIRRRRGADLAWNVWRLGPPVGSAVGIVALALGGMLTVGSALACYFVGGLIPLVFFIRRFWHCRTYRPSLSAMRQLLPYAWRSAAQTGASSVTGRLDQVVLATVVPSAQLGLYAVAVTTASITNMLTIGLPLALFGHQRAEQQGARSAERYRRSLLTTVAVSSGVALALALLAPLLLRLAFGRSFEAAQTSLRILLPGSVAFDVLGLMTSKLSADGRVGEVTRAAFLGAALTIVGLVVVVPRFGIEGASAVTSVTFASQVAYLALRERRHGAASPRPDVALGAPPHHP